jgi:hypothetical protein
VSAQRGIRALAMVFVALPFVFALIRAARTWSDLRYLWVAAASVCGAAAVTAVGRAHSRSAPAAIMLTAAAFLAATLVAVGAASLLGTSVGPGILVVASSFGVCSAIGCVLHARAGMQL